MKEDLTLWWNMLLTVRNIHPIGKVKDFLCKVEFEITGSCRYLVTAYFSRLKIYPRISVVTLVMFEFNILTIMLLRQTSQTNQMWNYTNWSNDSKLIVIVNIKKKTFIWSFKVSFCFTNHLIHNQVDYASSELHDSTQRKEIFPPTKTYCSFNKNFAWLLILMQCINKLYLSSHVIGCRETYSNQWAPFIPNECPSNYNLWWKSISGREFRL